MFGNKKKAQESYVNSPDQQIVNGLELQNPINVPNIYQNMPSQSIQNQQVQNQPVQVQQPVQQYRQLRQAKIIKGELNEEGEFYYIVVTNYPLTIGDCQLNN